MLLKSFAYDSAVSVVVFDSLDLSNPPQSFEGFIVKLVNVRHVGVGYHHIGQRLHITKSVSKPVVRLDMEKARVQERG